MNKRNYINRIKVNITIYASKKTSNILDGEYKSIHKGRSMDFDDLREYIVGDDIKDIDWKSSARTGNLLIRRFHAEKKHNIMIIFDTGKKMLADTEKKLPKKEVALMSAGTIAYLANKHGDEVGALYNKENGISYSPFRTGINNIEKILYSYEKDAELNNSASNLDKLLNYIIKNIKKKMIIFVVTDLEGMESVSESTIKRLSVLNDILFINIGDAYMTGENAYDIDKDSYIPQMFLGNSQLYEIEKKVKEEIYTKCVEKFKKYKISETTINDNDEIVMKIINLLERHRHANIR